MSNYSPSFDDDLDKVHSDESSSEMQELTPQEYKDSPEQLDREKVEKPDKKDNKIKATFKKYWWLVALLGVLGGGVAIVRPLGKRSRRNPRS